MPSRAPHLHPRSRLTSSLFATTLFASFFVVALPHVLPCPAPRVAYADSAEDGAPQRRRRRAKTPVDSDGLQHEALKTSVLEEDPSEELASVASPGKVERQCPVPKPSGLVGEILGFKEPGSSRGGKGERPP